jgi:hypothetical protein
MFQSHNIPLTPVISHRVQLFSQILAILIFPCCAVDLFVFGDMGAVAVAAPATAIRKHWWSQCACLNDMLSKIKLLLNLFTIYVFVCFVRF